MNEEVLFYYIKGKYINDLRTTDQFCFCDCYSFNNRQLLELKCRQIHYSQLLIEYPKYQKLMQSATKHNYTPYYINSTPLGIFSFDLSIVTPAWGESRLMPATTEFDNNTKIYKQVGYLDIEQAQRI